MESRLLLTQVRDLFIHSLSVCLLSARRFHPLVHPKSSWCIRGKTRDQVVHLDMAETDPDLDQDFPKMSIS